MSVLRILGLRRIRREPIRREPVYCDLLRAGQDPRAHALPMTALLHGGPAPR